jgi:tRNA(fMet)-specific endonuclease VapC
VRFCLDTSAYSHFKRGEPAVVDLIDRAEWLGMRVIVLGELAVGFRRGRRAREHQSELTQFLDNRVVEVLPLSEDLVGIYADIVLDLRQSGTPLPVNDIWIAAVAVRWGAPVLTYDSPFRSIVRVGVTVLTASPA